jgi:hypothetical protein
MSLPQPEGKYGTLLFIITVMQRRALIGVPELQPRLIALIRTWCLPIISAKSL